MNRVVLTKEEAAWFSRNVINSLTIMEKASSKDPKIKERSTYRVLSKIKDQAEALRAPEAKLEIHLERKHRSVIYVMIQGTVRVLEEKIIPEYVKRGDTFKKYEDDARKKLTLLKSMMRKFR